MGIVLLGARLFLAAVFVVAALAKVADRTKQESGRSLIRQEATLRLKCTPAPALGIPALDLEHARAVRALKRLFETECGSSEDENHLLPPDAA